MTRAPRTLVGLLTAGLVAAGFVAAGFVAGRASAQDLSADISNHLIKITTDFTGDDVVVFGSTDAAGGNVVILITGPKTDMVVRRKERVGGVWANTRAVTYDGAPSFYRAATSLSTIELVKASWRRVHEIGLDNLRLTTEQFLDADEAELFREALMRLKVREGLYDPEIAEVRFVTPTLFRATIDFPSTVPTGIYTVEVLLVRNREVVSGVIRTIDVRKAGVEAEIFQFAKRKPAVYALIAITVALVAGWIGHIIFRRG